MELDDIVLYRNIQPGTMLKKDVMHDSNYILNNIVKIGDAIRKSIHWVDAEEPIYLLMDNAGRHGSNVTKKEYVALLKDKYNVLVEWQVANSPKLNMLDRGAWMAVQSKVEELHKNLTMQNGILAESVQSAFVNLSQNVLSNIYERWEKVFSIIMKASDDNSKVETY